VYLEDEILTFRILGIPEEFPGLIASFSKQDFSKLCKEHQLREGMKLKVAQAVPPSKAREAYEKFEKYFLELENSHSDSIDEGLTGMVKQKKTPERWVIKSCELEMLGIENPAYYDLTHMSRVQRLKGLIYSYTAMFAASLLLTESKSG
jgi:hypothetical protein